LLCLYILTSMIVAFDQVLLKMFFGEFFQWFWKVLIVTDPLFPALVLLALTKNLTADGRRAIANRAWIASISINLSAFLFGNKILELCGISNIALSIGGGLLLAKCGLDILNENESINVNTHDIAIVPLAMPAITGPADLVLYINASTQWSIPIILALISVQLLVYLSLRMAIQVADVLNGNLIKISQAIVGLLTIFMGIQFILNGIQDFYTLLC